MFIVSLSCSSVGNSTWGDFGGAAVQSFQPILRTSDCAWWWKANLEREIKEGRHLERLHEKSHRQKIFEENHQGASESAPYLADTTLPWAARILVGALVKSGTCGKGVAAFPFFYGVLPSASWTLRILVRQVAVSTPGKKGQLNVWPKHVLPCICLRLYEVLLLNAGQGFCTNRVGHQILRQNPWRNMPDCNLFSSSSHFHVQQFTQFEMAPDAFWKLHGSTFNIFQLVTFSTTAISDLSPSIKGPLSPSASLVNLARQNSQVCHSNLTSIICQAAESRSSKNSWTWRHSSKAHPCQWWKSVPRMISSSRTMTSILHIIHSRVRQVAIRGSTWTLGVWHPKP